MLFAAIALVLWEYPIVLVSVVLALGAIGRGMLTLYKWAKGLEETIIYVKHEMELNSGKTMRDAIDRLEGSHNKIINHLIQQDETMVTTAAELLSHQKPLEVAGELTLIVEEPS